MKSPVSVKGKEFILNQYLINTDSYDLIIGYRADDSYFAFARDFISNTISLEQLNYAMKLGELKEQFVLISEKAFEKIKFISSEPVSRIEYFPKELEEKQEMKTQEICTENNWMKWISMAFI